MRKLLNTTAIRAPANETGTAPAKGGLAKAEKAMVKAIREAFESDRGHDMRITDQAILAIVNSQADWDDMDGEEQMKLFDTAEDAFKGIAVSDPGISGIVAKFDKAFFTELDECIEAVIKAKQSGVDMYGQFKRLYSADQLDAMPYPGSDADDVKGTNYTPDIVVRKAVAGGEIRTVFVDDLVEATPQGKAWQKDIDEAGKELKVSGAIARFKNVGKQQLRGLINEATQQRNAFRKLVRTSLQLHHKLRAIEMMPLVRCSWIRGDVKNPKCPLVPKDYQSAETMCVSRSPRPLWITPIVDGIEDGANGQEFSVSQVIAFDPSWAMKQPEGGTLGNLKDSAKGEPETPETLGEKMTDDAMDTTAVVMVAKLRNTTQRAALRTRALQPDNETMRAAYCELAVLLDGFKKANAGWYEAYLDKQEKADTKETAEQTAKGAARLAATG